MFFLGWHLFTISLKTELVFVMSYRSHANTNFPNTVNINCEINNLSTLFIV